MKSIKYLIMYVGIKIEVKLTLYIFRLGAVMCLGVTAGAYILTLFAVSHSPSVVVSMSLSISFDQQSCVLLTADKILTTCYGSDSCFPAVQSTILDRVVM